MIALVLALLLAAQEPTPAAPPSSDAPQVTAPAPPAEPAAASPPPADEPPWPTGAPRDDYGFVGWCYGILEGYLAQHDRVMPDVTRIEKTYRRPGSSLADDLKVYADQQVQGRAHLAAFNAALQAAEKASLSSLRPRGEAAIAKGRAVWAPAANLSTRTVAQQWMGWTLPQACPVTADRLKANAALMGVAFGAGTETPGPAPAPEAPKAAPEEGAPPEAPLEPPPAEGPPALREAPGPQ